MLIKIATKNRGVKMRKIVIIGGGVAGLSAGIYARLAGYDAEIYEKHFVPGGNLTGWQRGEYHIDNCIHWLTGTNENSSLHQMWLDLGVLGDGTGIVQGNSLFTCDRDGLRVCLPPSLPELREGMLRVSPEDKAEINRFCNAVELLMATDNIAGEGCDEGVSIGRVLRGAPSMLRYFGLTTSQLARRFKSTALQSFITGFWGDDFGAFALIFVFATYCGKNGALPEGGSLKTAKRLAERFESLGGRLYLNREAVKVNLEGDCAVSVAFSNGEVASGDYIILTTDTAVTFSKLLDVPMPKKLRKQYDNPKLRRFSAYHAAFSCDLAELPFEGDLIFDVPEEYVDTLGTKQLILREFSHEPSYAPEGKNILQTLTFCFVEDCVDFIRLRNENKEAYNLKKQHLAGILQMLIEEHCPTLKGKLSLIDFWTPASYERFIGSEVGSFMSFAIPESFIPIPLDCAVDGVKNLFIATQWQQSPGGLPVAASQGKATIEKIKKLEKKK